jgi:hypothetical protein
MAVLPARPTGGAMRGGRRASAYGRQAEAPEESGADMSHRPDRRTNHELRARIDKLLGRVHDARLEVVERGLTAAHPVACSAASPLAARDRAAVRERREA